MLERFTVDGLGARGEDASASAIRCAARRHPHAARRRRRPRKTWRRCSSSISASGPLDPETRDEFEARYGIPVRVGLWRNRIRGFTVRVDAGHQREFGASKRNSVGRALPDTQVRIVDPETGAELATGEQGLLEARVAPISPDWIRTTDIASIDSDGFVTLHGRADGAINRGGFKILPETIRRVLISHPAVRDACVVGVPDARLGEVPFAAIEITPGMPVPSDDELKDLVRQSLPVYNVPVAFTVVVELPRNPALKVSLPDVAALYEPRANR